MADKTIVIGANLRAATTQGSMGVVTDLRYVMCYWPKLDEPVALFAEGSSGIEVQGPPTPRNVVFPPDTVFLPVLVNDAQLGQPPRWRETDIPTKGDCFFIRTEEMGEAIEPETVTRAVEVEPGMLREVQYTKEKTVQRLLPVLRDLTIAEAIEHTGKRDEFADAGVIDGGKDPRPDDVGAWSGRDA